MKKDQLYLLRRTGERETIDVEKLLLSYIGPSFPEEQYSALTTSLESLEHVEEYQGLKKVIISRRRLRKIYNEHGELDLLSAERAKKLANLRYDIQISNDGVAQIGNVISHCDTLDSIISAYLPYILKQTDTIRLRLRKKHVFVQSQLGDEVGTVFLVHCIERFFCEDHSQKAVFLTGELHKYIEDSIYNLFDLLTDASRRITVEKERDSQMYAGDKKRVTTTTFEKWYEFSKHLSLDQIFYLIDKLNVREKVAVVKYFGYFDNYTANAFAEKFRFSRTASESSFAQGVQSMIEQLPPNTSKCPQLNWPQAKALLHSIRNINPYDLLRYKKDDLIEADGITFKLAEIGYKSSQTLLDLPLTKAQHRALQLFLRDCKYGFFTLAEIAQQLSVTEETVRGELQRVYEKYVHRDTPLVSTSFATLVENTPLHQIVSKWQQGSLDMTTLNPRERLVVETFFSSANGVFPTIREIAAQLNLTHKTVSNLLLKAERKLLKKSDDYFICGRRIKPDSVRIRLISLSHNSSAKKSLTHVQKKILQLATSREGNNFTYSNLQIAEMVGISESFLTAQITTISRLDEEVITQFIDYHGSVIRAGTALYSLISLGIQNNSEVDINDLSPEQQTIFAYATTPDKKGHYPDLAMLAQNFNIHRKNISEMLVEINKILSRKT